jgi:hypothetical protein
MLVRKNEYRKFYNTSNQGSMKVPEGGGNFKPGGVARNQNPSPTGAQSRNPRLSFEFQNSFPAENIYLDNSPG